MVNEPLDVGPDGGGDQDHQEQRDHAQSRAEGARDIATSQRYRRRRQIPLPQAAQVKFRDIYFTPQKNFPRPFNLFIFFFQSTVQIRGNNFFKTICFF